MSKSNQEREVQRKVYQILEKGGYHFIEDAFVSGSPTDFYVEAPKGGTIVLNVKNIDEKWIKPLSVSTLANSYQKASGADYSYIVVPDSTAFSLPTNIVTVSKVGEMLSNLPPKRKRKRPDVKREKPTLQVFAAMPFTDKYYDTYEVAFVPACYQYNAKCIRIDHSAFAGDIVSEIKKQIQKSLFVIADLSDNRPNVLYEIGYATALKKKVIQVCSTDFNNIPFDVRNDKTIKYMIGATMRLKNKLINVIGELIPVKLN